MEDKTIVCKDCGSEFVFTKGEQEFYKEKGFENDPVRCPECRQKENNKEIIETSIDNIESRVKGADFQLLFYKFNKIIEKLFNNDE